MKFIVKVNLAPGIDEYYLEVGQGSTPNRDEAAIFDSKVVVRDKRINFKSWLDKRNVRVIPVGDL
ncbi:hypothetical protein A2a_00021 [Klebsiella phage VLCpiA2a]|nr:hypothetical protein A2a_00021 [Klebsiella phage VLCpiA2a]UVX31993.1 hypothetical protein A2b_00033 [Klebsiella phage VLCpiA2b]